MKKKEAGLYYRTMNRKSIKFVFAVLMHLIAASFANCGEVTVMAYNLCNYFVREDRQNPLKPESSKQAIVEMVKAADPDIFMAIEIGGGASKDEFQKLLARADRNYPHVTLIEGDDSSRHIVLYSRIKPAEVRAVTDLSYKIKNKKSGRSDELRVQRGFLHALFTFEGKYRLHVVAAHLKSRVFNSSYNQTDMRRYEARLLRHLINGILDKEPSANILVLGDLNDSYDSSPMRALRDDDKPNTRRLYDLRPSDKWGLSWTHWWNQEDIYSRIDYALCTHSLLPEIVPEKTGLVHVPDLWMFASDHRPVLVTVRTTDSAEMPDTVVDKSFPRLDKASGQDEEGE